MAADTIKLAQGTDTLDINDGTTYKIKRVFLSTPPDKDLWHVPDYGEAQLVRAEPSDRPCTIDMTVAAADEDALQNNIVVLRRWLMNEAKRAEIDRDTDSVYLTILKSGGTNTVKHLIKNAYVDDSASHYTQFRKTTIALHVTIHLVLAPYGEWDTAITLQNDMFSSPHMVEDSDDNGLVDGWAEIDGAETTTIDSTDWLIGGKSQKVVAGSDNFGIKCVTIINAADTTAVGFVWVYVATGDVDVHLYDEDAGPAAPVDSTDATSGNATKTLTGTGGNTWWKIEVSSDSIPAGNDVRLYVLAKGGAATFYVDGAYLELGTTTAPDAWSSAKNIDNRNDILSATENYLNYVDVWGIPGDAPAIADWTITTTSAAPRDIFMAGRQSTGQNDNEAVAGGYKGSIGPVSWLHWIEDASLFDENNTNGSWATVDPSGTTADKLFRFTAAGGVGTGTAYYDFGVDVNTTQEALWKSDRHVFVLARSSHTDTTYTLSTTEPACSQNKTAQITAIAAWELLDIGSISGKGLYLDTISNFDIKITVAAVPNGETADIDAIFLMPTDEHLIWKPNTEFSSGALYLSGQNKTVYRIGFAEAPLGTFWYLEPGNSVNRCIFAIVDGSDVFTIADSMIASLSIIPRTRHLMGT